MNPQEEIRIQGIESEVQALKGICTNLALANMHAMACVAAITEVLIEETSEFTKHTKAVIDKKMEAAVMAKCKEMGLPVPPKQTP
jgi:hypothetical protein